MCPVLATAVIPVATANARTTENPNIDAWIIKLEIQESGRRADISIIDKNGKRSAGCLMFQDNTWKNYSRLYGTGFTAEDIWSCSKQKRLAVLMLKDNYRNWRAWYTSVKEIGLPPIL